MPTEHRNLGLCMEDEESARIVEPTFHGHQTPLAVISLQHVIEQFKDSETYCHSITHY